jgi:eukaryotic-like serine/threonine-protein kinase
MAAQTIGRYEIERELGQGGMAAVYLAYDPRFRRRVAIKLLPPTLQNDPMFRARFEREAQTIAALEHPAIVPVYDFGEEAGSPYLVMRYMEGGSLNERLQRGGPLSLPLATAVLHRLAGALDQAHQQGIIHRDLKPDNVLFDRAGAAYLTDFGIVKLATEATTGITGDFIVGTPAYMSPEQARGEGQLDRRSDVYALGALLFTMLAGHPPYEADTPVGYAVKHVTEPVPSLLRLRPDLPPVLELVLRRALAKNPANRYATAGELARAVAVAQAAPVDAAPASEAVTAMGTRLWLWLLIAGGLALLLICLGTATLWIAGRGPFALDATRASDVVIGVPPGAAAVPTRQAPATDPALPSTPAITATATPDLPLLALPVTAANVAQMVQLAQLGRGSLNALALLPDGQRVATGGGSGVWLFDLDSGQANTQLDGHTQVVRALASTGDGLELASGGGDGRIIVWNLASGNVERRLDGHEDWVRALAWSPDDTLLASGSSDQTVRLWERASGRQTMVLPEPSASVRDVAWSSDGVRLAAADNNGLVHIWNPSSGTRLQRLEAHRGIAFAVAWAPNRPLVASAGADGMVRLWDAERGSELQALRGHQGFVLDVSWSADGARLASAGQDGTVRVWDAATGNELRRLEGHRGMVLAVRWRAGGRMLVSAGEDGLVRVWDAATGEETAGHDWHSAPANSVSWSPAGDQLAVGSSDQTVQLWDVGSRTPAEALRGPTVWVSSVAWAPDGATVAAADFNGWLWWWPAGGGQTRANGRHGAIVNELAWSPEGEWLASAGNDGAIRLWDSMGTAVAALTGEQAVTAVAWAPDSRQIAGATGAGTVTLWDAVAREPAATLQAEAPVLALAWSGDGRLLAAGQEDGRIVIWEVAGQEITAILEGHSGNVSRRWSGLRMHDCWPRPASTVPSASGRPVRRQRSTCSRATVMRCGMLPGLLTAPCSPPPAAMERCASGACPSERAR